VPPSLKTASVEPVIERITGNPLVPNYVVNPDAAIQLGKALFWDMQVGSDGQACASCHFHAGADSRAKNQLSTGFIGGNGVFDLTRSGGIGPNHTLVAEDYPFHDLADPNDRDSMVLFDTDDVTSSMGVFPTNFVDIVPGSVPEITTVIGAGTGGDPKGFHVGGVNVRRVEPRNTPTTINAAFNLRNFWDGRANEIFNGVNPFGRRDTNARILEAQMDGSVCAIQVELTNSSLGSQACGPPLSDFEMSAAGRSFSKLGKKMLALPPLGLQLVDPNDSVLAPFVLDADFNGVADLPGLTTTYAAMIQNAFDPRFWASDKLFDAAKNEIGVGAPANTDEFTQMESNFSFFWGIAVQLYESTLISDDSLFDQVQDGTASFTPEQQHGLDLFMGQGRCINCHGTAMFTKASTLHLVAEAQEEGLVERMLMGQDHSVYSVIGTGWIFDGTYLWRIQVRAEGTLDPAPPGSTHHPGSGTIRVRRIPGGALFNTTYQVQTFELNADWDPATIDVQLHATYLSGGTGNDPEIALEIVKNPMMGMDQINLVGNRTTAIQGPLLVGSYKINSLAALYDNGFYNIGVRPSFEDLGVGGMDPFGNPLSFTEQFKKMLRGIDVPDPFQVNPCTFEIRWDLHHDLVFFPGGFDPLLDCDGDLNSDSGFPANNATNTLPIKKIRTAVKGAFKVPTLRNVTLTGPYFHNGGQATLEQVVRFYNRGGDFDNTPHQDPDIQPLGLTEQDIQDLLAFLETLTDARVANEEGPFDRPQIFVPNGHVGDSFAVVDADMNGQADDDLLAFPAAFGLELPPVGADGRAGKGLPPLVNFLE
jgi:cytochrome c peroxidase